MGCAMNAELRKRLAIGCLGALSPILANLLIVDLQVTLASATPLVVAAYLLRVLVLCAAACIIVYLNHDENRPIKIFQLGIAAPALLTGIINGAAVSNTAKQDQAPQQQQQRTQQQSPSSYFEIPGLIGKVFAQSASRDGNVAPNQPSIEDCANPKDPSISQQFLQGFAGIVPDNRWFVVISSNINIESAVGDVATINRQFPGRFKPKICAPPRGDKFYRVVIGEYLNYQAASKLRDEIVRAGIQKDAWLWTPFNA